MKASPSPGPWKADTTPKGKSKVVDVNGFSVCNTTSGPYSEQAANAEFIVRACNAFPSLLATLKQIVADWDSVSPDMVVPDEINVNDHWDAARAAIALAEGGGK